MTSFTFWDVFQKKNLSSRFDPNSIMQITIIKFPLLILVLIFSFCWIAQSATARVILQAKSKGMQFQVETVAERLRIPWGMVFIAPDKVLFTERNGKVGILVPSSGEVTYLQGGPKVQASGQGGLLDAAVHPGYQAGDWIYFTYSKAQKGKGQVKSATTLARAKLQGEQLVELEDMLVTQSVSGSDYHFGSRITFDGEGHLFFSIGDRGHRPNSQDLGTHSGSILRLKIDGSVPDDNPLVNRTDALPEIWSYGHRNPQGLFYDRQRKRLWSIEHGPRGGDEINLINPGLNYGWPVISYGKEYFSPAQVGESTHKEGMEQPVKYYVPSIAPGSLIVYSGKAFPDWKGNLFSGALAKRHLNRVEIDPDGNAVAEERLLEKLRERIRAIVESPEGWIYLSTDMGKILRLSPAE